MTTTITDTEIDTRKRAAVAELREHQDRKRREREAREAASLSADEEIAREIRARRAEEERIAQVRAASARMMEDHERKLAAAREEDRQRRLDADPRLRIAEHPARRVALMLRRTLGDQFDVIVAELRAVDFRQLKIELAKIPHAEAAEAAHHRNEEIKAKLAEQASTLPEPADDAERAIYEKYGFISPTRAAELDAGAL